MDDGMAKLKKDDKILLSVGMGWPSIDFFVKLTGHSHTIAIFYHYTPTNESVWMCSGTKQN